MQEAVSSKVNPRLQRAIERQQRRAKGRPAPRRGEAGSPPSEAPRIIAFSSLLVLVVAVVVILLVYLTRGSSSTGPGAGKTPVFMSLPASALSQLAAVPDSVLNAVPDSEFAQINPPRKISGSQLREAGKPEILYIGAEWCPYCAAERWPLALALAKFGTLSNVKQGYSAGAPEVYPHTPTLSFDGTTYTSQYVSFVPVENQNIDRKVIHQVSTEQMQLWNRYDNGQPAFPFIDIANRFKVDTQYNPQVLSGYTPTQVISSLQSPGSTLARTIAAAADEIIAAICETTASKAPVCSLDGVKRASAHLGG
jgi:thiol-disulfide isomerase/thioredoxin